MIERDPATSFPIFKPDGPTLKAFMRDRTSAVKIIQGPQGSGTSSACCIHIFQQALEQPKQADGRQRFRAHIFRETYAKIEATVLQTWLDWFKPGTRAGEFGVFYETRPYRHEVRVGPLELDVTFMALEDIRDAKSYFDSLEPSLLWFNEGQHAQLAVIRHGLSRVSPPRYPAVKDGGCAWGGLIIDTNAPPADHWIPIMRGDTPAPDWMSEDARRALVKPANWTFYMQPAGLIEDFDDKGRLLGYRPNPAAENLKYLHKENVDPLGPDNFYMQKLGAQPKQWIDAYIMNRSSVVTDGQPVYPQFRRDVHVSDRNLEPIPGIPVSVGIDPSGKNPAALIGQNLRGDWFIQREFIGLNTFVDDFAPALKGFLAQHYPGFHFSVWGAPDGAFGGTSSDNTPFKIFRKHGLDIIPTWDGQNRQSIRQEAVNAVMMRRSQSGRPSSLLVDPRCTTYITGMSGGYFMRRIRVSGERYADEPEKNQYCVPLSSLALTPDGWRGYDELAEGDPIYVMGAKGIEVGEVKGMNVFEGPQDVIAISNAEAEWVSTAHHRNIIKNGTGTLKAVATKDLKDGHKLLHPPAETRPRKQQPFSDDFVALAGWVMAEGTYRPDDDAIILAQSFPHNPEYCADIDALAERLTNIRQVSRGPMRTWRITKETAWALRQWMPHKVPSAAFIARMSNANRRRFLFEFLRGDGCFSNGTGRKKVGCDQMLTRNRDLKVGTGTIRAFQKSREAVSALMMLGALLGIPIISREKGDGFMLTVAFSRAATNTGNMKRNTRQVDGVWCPTTTGGSWICRQGGRAWLTGNSHICEAGETLLLGGGEGRTVTMGGLSTRPVQVWNKRKTMRRVG